jgi:hypothetical protein
MEEAYLQLPFHGRERQQSRVRQNINILQGVVRVLRYGTNTEALVGLGKNWYLMKILNNIKELAILISGVQRELGGQEVY